MRRNLERTENQMKSLSSGIDDVTSEVKKLSEQLNVYTQEAAVLEIKLEDTRNTLKSTEVLVEKLSSEYNNWNEEYGKINDDIKHLDKQSFLIGLNLTHFSHLLQSEKQKFTKLINDRLRTEFSLNGTLYSDQDSLVWQSFGLGADRQSVENASLLTQVTVSYNFLRTYFLIKFSLVLELTIWNDADSSPAGSHWKRWQMVEILLEKFKFKL